MVLSMTLNGRIVQRNFRLDGHRILRNILCLTGRLISLRVVIVARTQYGSVTRAHSWLSVVLLSCTS